MISAVLVALLAAALAALVGAYSYLYPTYTYRYRLTLEVELPDGSARTGSSVVEVEQGLYPRPIQELGNGGYVRVTGEAAVVDLGGGRLLVALLTRRTRWTDAPGQGRRGWAEKEPTRLLARAYGEDDEWRGRHGRNPGLGRLARRRGAREIGPGDLPDLVTFGDASDPRTVWEVDPRDLAASFGPGVRLRRAAIEVTGDPVTEGAIERRLPWLKGMEGRLDGNRYGVSAEFANVLLRRDFIMRRL